MRTVTLTNEDVKAAITLYLREAVFQGPYLGKLQVNSLKQEAAGRYDGAGDWTVTLEDKPEPPKPEVAQ